MVQKDDDLVRFSFSYEFPDGTEFSEEHEYAKNLDLITISNEVSRIVEKFVEDKRAHNENDLRHYTILALPDGNINIPIDESSSTYSLMSKSLEMILGALNEDSTILSVKTSFLNASEKFSLTSTKKHHYRRTHKKYNCVKTVQPSNNMRTVQPSNNIKTVQPNYVGLVNQAMTCYLNSLLQALYMTPEFRNALYTWEYQSSNNDSERSIPFQLQKLFLNLQTSSKRAVETTSLTKSFGWDSSEAWHQHDIQELCRVMFDALEQKFKDTAQADLINRLYEGKINDYVKCLTCNTEKSREDTFLDIPLPVRPFDASAAAYGSVEEALEAFVKYETLEGNNQYFCENCNIKSDAHKGLKFTKFPYILTLQLKRFDFDQSSYHRIKLNDKVTFPDILNLNPFIESTSNKESPSGEEDDGMSAKCNDSSTTDSSVMDEIYSPSDADFNSIHHINNEQDDDGDEGMDMSNGMSSSSSMHNDNIEKIREEYISTKGPYFYELFSIMIHSGSANGGHYYVYIKDFRNNKWLSFNDQSVQPINQEEIQKSYGGGGGSKSYYGGAYRSSTNAYMLMYRQIDRERNVLPMKAEDFPPHIKDLLEKIKSERKTEEDRSYRDGSLPWERQRSKCIYFRHPITGSLEEVTIALNLNTTLAEITELAYKAANIKDYVDLDQCRIVRYHKKYDLVYCTYDEQEDQALDIIFQNKNSAKNVNMDGDFISNHLRIDLLLDIRQKDEQFEDYPSTPLVMKVYIIDPIDKELVGGPKYIRAYEEQTVKEFKQELKKHFNLNPNMLQLFSPDFFPEKALLDDAFIFEKLIKDLKTCYKIFATDVSENFRESEFYSTSLYVDENIISFDLDTSCLNKDQREKLGVPSLSEYYRDENSKYKNCNKLTSKMDKLKIISEQNKNNKNNTKNTPVVQVSDREEWNIHETSNSEDSSLSDSDRTLVGDVPTEFDFDCVSSEEYPHSNLFEQYVPSLMNKNDAEYIRILPSSRSDLLKIAMHHKTSVETLKEKLEEYIKIPRNYFKITENAMNAESVMMFRNDRTYSIVLGRILALDEKNLDIYLLEMGCTDPLRKLFTMIIKKSTTVEDVKQQILLEVKRNNNIELPLERCRFFTELGLIPLDNIVNKDNASPYLSNSIDAICIQKLPDESLMNPETQSVIYVMKDPALYDDPHEIIVDNDHFTEQIKEKISKLSNIPVECLEFCPSPFSKMNQQLDSMEWKSDITLDRLDHTTYLLYRNSRDSQIIISSRTSNTLSTCSLNCNNDNLAMSSRSERRAIFMSTPMNSSPRKERALRINVNST